MNICIAILIGALFTSGIYCLLRRGITKLIVGTMLLSQAVNLLVFSSAGLNPTTPAFVDPETKLPPANHADPLAQALVLTAIVISFGLVIFTISLLLKAHRAVGSEDINDFNRTDRL